MPTYALLGATGSTGSAILRCLLSQPPPSLILNIFVRSLPKLRKAFPDLEKTTAFKANIIEGISSDTAATRDCLKNTEVVFACIGSNEPTRGMTLVYNTAIAITDALEFHQKDQGFAYKPPTVIQLRSASLNPVLKARMPWIAPKMSWFFFYYVYMGLDRACKVFELSATASPKLLDYIYVDPPSIHDPNGTTTTGHKLILDEGPTSTISYADLGAGFCEVAERKEEFAGKGVGVTATGTVTETWGTLRGYMLKGLKSRITG